MRLRILLAVLAGFLLPPAALAHITIREESAPSGGFAKLTFGVPHGCESSPTTALTVQIPEGVLSVTPEVNPGWEISREIEQLDPPIESEGETVSERVATVTWSGGPLAPDELTEFGLSVRMPDQPGETLFFPTVQTCQQGEHGWIEIPAQGQDPFELESPAPFVALIGAQTEGDGAAASQETTAEGEGVAAPVPSDDDDGGNGLEVLALGLGAAGLAAGLAALGLSVLRRPRRGGDGAGTRGTTP